MKNGDQTIQVAERVSESYRRRKERDVRRLLLKYKEAGEREIEEAIEREKEELREDLKGL